MAIGIVAPIGKLTGGAIGVSPAEARSYYTRKRVNGRWITGMFPREDLAPPTRRRQAAALAAADGGDEEAVPPLPPHPVELGVARVFVAVAEPSVTTSALATFAAPLAEVGSAAEERLRGLKDALRAKAEALVVTPVAAALGASGPADRPVPAAAASKPGPAGAAERLPAVSTASPAAVAPLPAPLAPLKPKSVSYDFETGIKTTVYESSVVREPFDVAATRGIVPPPTASR